MVAVTDDVAKHLLSRQTSNDDETLGALLYFLRRSLASEAIDELLWEDLEAVLGVFADLGSHDIVALAGRLREATTKIVEAVQYLVQPYPVAEMQRLIIVSAEHPHPQDAQGHLRRLALAILAILDLIGDDAT